MRMVKAVLLTLLALMLLALCGFLPALTAHIQDRHAERPMQAAVIPVMLETEDITNRVPAAEAMGILDKVAILNRCFLFPVTPEVMSMSPAQVQEETLLALEPYISMGVIPRVTYSHVSTEPLVAMSVNSLGSYFTFWSVYLVHEDDPYESMMVHLDDQTGKLLLIQYEGYSQSFEKDVQRALLEEITTTYLDNLELPEALEALSDPDISVALVDLGEMATAISCSIVTDLYAPILVEITMTENDFHIAYPNSPD